MAVTRRKPTLTGWILLLGLLAAPASTLAGKQKGPTWAPPDHWCPYFQTKDGLTKPVLEPIGANNDKDWMLLRYTEHSGPRQRIAVMQVENKSATLEQAEHHEGTVIVNQRLAQVPVASIEEVLATSLHNTHRFMLVERKAIDAVVAEQDLGGRGIVTAQSAAKAGKMLGAELLIFGSVNDWMPCKKKVGGGGGGIGRKFAGGVGFKKSKAEVAMSFRIVDADTGQVLHAMSERATAGSWGIGGGAFGKIGGLMGYEKNSPISYAVQACINKAVYRIAEMLKERPWRGSVIKVSAGNVYINAGSNNAISVGMHLRALSKGEELIDPETGISLGAELEATGDLAITTVKEKYSIASIIAGCSGLKSGDRVELSD